MFSPGKIPGDPAYREVLGLFERRGKAVQYRVAQLLCSPTLQLFGLAELLGEAVRRDRHRGDPSSDDETRNCSSGTAAGVTERRSGRSFRRFTTAASTSPRGLAAVLLGSTWHYIDTAGRTRLSFPGCEAVKPFRNGRAQVVRSGRRIEKSTAREGSFPCRKTNLPFSRKLTIFAFKTHETMTSFRNLTPAEIAALETLGNSAEDWTKVTVARTSNPASFAKAIWRVASKSPGERIVRSRVAGYRIGESLVEGVTALECRRHRRSETTRRRHDERNAAAAR